MAQLVYTATTYVSRALVTIYWNAQEELHAMTTLKAFNYTQPKWSFTRVSDDKSKFDVTAAKSLHEIKLTRKHRNKSGVKNTAIHIG